jgi:hypothetical protein
MAMQTIAILPDFHSAFCTVLEHVRLYCRYLQLLWTRRSCVWCTRVASSQNFDFLEWHSHLFQGWEGNLKLFFKTRLDLLDLGGKVWKIGKSLENHEMVKKYFLIKYPLLLCRKN